MPGPDGRAGWEELDDEVIVAQPSHTRGTDLVPVQRPGRGQGPLPHRRDGEDGVHGGRQRRPDGRPGPGGDNGGPTSSDDPVSPYLATLQIGRYVVTQLDSVVPVASSIPPGCRTR